MSKKIFKNFGFTTIELLVTITILAVLVVLIVVVINPTDLLKQGRDSNRVAALNAINGSLRFLTENEPGTFIGTSSVVYVSIPDTSPTCANLGLPALPTSTVWTYNCVQSSSSTRVDGTGWIPVNFQAISAGSPISQLPIDSRNTTSSGLYFTYTAVGSLWQLTAGLESSKSRSGKLSNAVSSTTTSTGDVSSSGVFTIGTDLTITPDILVSRILNAVETSQPAQQPPAPPAGVPWYDVAWGYRTKITIDHLKVSNTNQTDFPIVINSTDVRWKDISNSGHVGKANGGDIVFTASDGITKLNHEIEKYATTTGEVIAWVKIPILNTASDTDIYMYYGNGSALDQWNIAGTWDSNFKGVWHLPGGASLGTNDSTSNGNNLANVGYVSASTGQIGGGAGFTSSNYLYKDYAMTGFPAGTSQRTLEGWFKMSVNQVEEFMGWGDNSATGNRFALYWNNTGKLYLEIANKAATFPWTYDTGWHHFVATLPSGTTTSNILLYFDGVPQTVTGDGTTLNTTQTEFRIGGIPTYQLGFFYGGIIDEVRVSNIGRSADWIKTEYNNQSSPSTFYSIASEESRP